MADSIQTETDLSDAELLELFAGHGVYRDNAAQFRGRLAGKLLINRCTDCGRYHQPPRPMCPGCWSFQVVHTPVSGRGTIHLLMHLHAGPPAEGVDYQNQGHPVVVVELEEQDHLRVTGTTHGFGEAGPSIDESVELDFLYRGGAPIVAFRPSEPNQPNQPSEPNQPNQPSEPNQPNQPSEPNQPNQPSEPNQPNQPSEPSNRSRPSEPSLPNQRDRS